MEKKKNNEQQMDKHRMTDKAIFYVNVIEIKTKIILYLDFVSFFFF